MIRNKIIKFEEITSTNDYIKNNYKLLNDGDIVVAKKQSKGRGRRGNTWESEIGNLYFSFLIKNENGSYKNNFEVLMRVSVSIIELLERHGVEAQIKYPNDIIVERKKIAGILIETIGNQNLECFILGIGLNVNAKSFLKVNDKAISLFMIKNKKTDLDILLYDFVEIYNANTRKNDIYEKYLEKSYVIKKKVKYENKYYLITNITKGGNIELSDGENEFLISNNLISLESLYFQ